MANYENSNLFGYTTKYGVEHTCNTELERRMCEIKDERIFAKSKSTMLKDHELHDKNEPLTRYNFIGCVLDDQYIRCASDQAILEAYEEAKCIAEW